MGRVKGAVQMSGRVNGDWDQGGSSGGENSSWILDRF